MLKFGLKRRAEVEMERLASMRRAEQNASVGMRKMIWEGQKKKISHGPSGGQI